MGGAGGTTFVGDSNLKFLHASSCLSLNDNYLGNMRAAFRKTGTSKGLHVMTEKPMATRWADGLAMVKACDDARVRLFVVKQNRRNRTLQLLKQAVAKGRFGRIYMVGVNVFWSRPQSYYDSADWRGTWEFDGGAFMNQASHYVDLLSWMIGPVESVRGGDLVVAHGPARRHGGVHDLGPVGHLEHQGRLHLRLPRAVLLGLRALGPLGRFPRARHRRAGQDRLACARGADHHVGVDGRFDGQLLAEALTVHTGLLALLPSAMRLGPTGSVPALTSVARRGCRPLGASW